MEDRDKEIVRHQTTLLVSKKLIKQIKIYCLENDIPFTRFVTNAVIEKAKSSNIM